jgi:hypothetical protein
MLISLPNSTIDFFSLTPFAPALRLMVGYADE